MNEDFYWFPDESGARSMDEVIKHRVYMLPAEFWRPKPGFRAASYRRERATVRTLVQPAAVHPAPPDTQSGRPMDLDRGWIESIQPDPRNGDGPVVEGAAHVEFGRHTADLEVGSQETVMKTYAGALAKLTPWGRFWMRCFSVWLTIEAYCMPARSIKRAFATYGRKPRR